MGLCELTNGNELRRLCNGTGQTACIYYIVGAFDMMSSIVSHSAKICVPQSVEAGQLEGVVKRWLRDHPDKWHWTAAFIVEKALKEKFPCN